MVKAFKVFIQLKLKNKKQIHVALIFLVYAFMVLIFPNIIGVSLGWRLVIICSEIFVFILVFVPFISWYLTYYHES